MSRESRCSFADQDEGRELPEGFDLARKRIPLLATVPAPQCPTFLRGLDES
jgi:hypothetical protein